MMGFRLGRQSRMNDKGEILKKKIVETTKQHPEGLTTLDLAKITKAYRQTIAKYILVLEAKGIIYRRRVGSATLHYVKEQFVGTTKRKRGKI